MNEDRKPRSLFFPLLLVIVGVVIFLVNIGTISGTAWDTVLQYWPVLLILMGLDGLYKRDGWVGPIVLLGLGTVLLLGNLEYLSIDAWDLLVRLWPVLLVAIGLDIAFGKSRAVWNTFLRLGLGLLLVAAIVWIAVSSPFGVGAKQVDYEQSLDGATESQITFSLPVGELKIEGGAENTMLLSGGAGLPKSLDIDAQYSKPKNGASTLVLDTVGSSNIPLSSSTFLWDFKMNSGIPIDLETGVAVGEIDADLSEVMMQNLKSEMALGETTFILPCLQDASADLDVAIGEITLYVPKGCDLNINLDTGLVAHEYPQSYLRVDDNISNQESADNSPTLNVNIELAIGSVQVRELP